MKKKNLLSLRRLTQSAVFALFFYVIWATKHPLEGFFNPAVLFQLDPLVMILTSIAERIVLPGIIFSALTLAVTFLLGRVFCGWFCPLGAVMDLTAAVSGRFKRFREKEPGRILRSKYFVLGALTLLAVLGIQYLWFFDPLTIFVRTFSFNIHPFINNSIDRVFQIVLPLTGFFTPLDLFYSRLKEGVLNLGAPEFPHVTAIFIVFVTILALVFVRRRFWCRFLCPLGALLALVARFSPFRRIAAECKSGCTVCRDVCRTNAIRSNNSYRKEECILCLDCVVVCPRETATFSFAGQEKAENLPDNRKGMSRADFLVWMSGTALAVTGIAAGRRPGASAARRTVIRPPAALREDEFVQRCVRCGNCMKVCITNVLQPATLESGIDGIWTPHLVTDIGYCEYKCTLCGAVCPTGAIKPLTVEEKMKTKLGIAVIDKRTCLPWSAKEQECLVCEEHCPTSDKAIKMKSKKRKDGSLLKLPVVVRDLCVGCVICENKCPVRPRAIRVFPL